MGGWAGRWVGVCVCVGGCQVLVRAISQCLLVVTLGSCLHSDNWLKLTYFTNLGNCDSRTGR